MNSAADAREARAFAASIIEESKHVTYDMKANRNDPAAIGTRQMDWAFCARLQSM